MPRIKLDALGYVFIALSLLCLSQIVILVVNDLSMSSWVRAHATIVNTSTNTQGMVGHSTKAPTFTLTAADIQYRFSVNGKEYLGYGVRNAPTSSSQSHNKGVLIVYNPLKPEENTIDAGFPLVNVLFWLLGTSASLGCLYGWQSIRKKYQG